MLVLDFVFATLYNATIGSILSSVYGAIGWAVFGVSIAYLAYRKAFPSDAQRWVVNFNNVLGSDRRELARLMRAPPEFSGQEDVSIWLAKMEQYLTITASDKHLWAAIAISHINSSKLKNVRLDDILNDHTNGFERLKTELRRNVGERRDERPVNIRTIAARTQRPNENVQQYGDKLKEMALAAFPGSPAQVVDDNIKEIFVSGLRDDALREKAGDKWIKTKDQHLPFEALVKYIALKEENSKWQREYQQAISSSTSNNDSSANESHRHRRDTDRQHDSQRFASAHQPQRNANTQRSSSVGQTFHRPYEQQFYRQHDNSQQQQQQLQQQQQPQFPTRPVQPQQHHDSQQAMNTISRHLFGPQQQPQQQQQGNTFWPDSKLTPQPTTSQQANALNTRWRRRQDRDQQGDLRQDQGGGTADRTGTIQRWHATISQRTNRGVWDVAATPVHDVRRTTSITAKDHRRQGVGQPRLPRRPRSNATSASATRPS